MSQDYPIADWSRLRAEPDLPVPLPGGGALLLRRIPAGSFFMGSRGGSADEEPRHRVVIPRDFYLGKFVVTQAEWRAVAATSKELTAKPGLDPSDERNKGDRRPVTDVSWDDANAWCGALLETLPGDAKERLTEHLPGGWHFRLPTEAEWEYACRAGTDTDYHSGDGEAALTEVGWFGEDWEKGAAHPVGEKPPNAAGLHDMHGNVWELCRDIFRNGENCYRRRVDGDLMVEEELRENEYYGELRAFRGGSWGVTSWRCRSACRNWREPLARGLSQGFRLCLAPGPGVVAEALPRFRWVEAERRKGIGATFARLWRAWLRSGELYSAGESGGKIIFR